jgi:SET domain
MLEVRMTETMGRGVFATRPIAAGEALGSFHTQQIPPAEVLAGAGTKLSNFWFEDDRDGSAYVVFGVIELVNHSLRPNVGRAWRLTEVGYVVDMTAVSAIGAGEQLFLDYKFTGVAADPDWAQVRHRS